ncbi:hypothetical protein ACUY2J_05040 [Corynebacterium kroppenstedtii]
MPNILKTIEPLFLDDLKEQFDSAYNSVARLEKLLNRIAGIKIFNRHSGWAVLPDDAWPAGHP